MVTWNQRLRETYNKKFKTVVEFSKQSGISKDSIHKYLKEGVSQPRGQTLEKLALALGVDLLWLKEGIHICDTEKSSPGPISKDAFMEILTQVHMHCQHKCMETQIMLAGKCYEELKSDPDIDPGYVRWFFRTKAKAKLLY